MEDMYYNYPVNLPTFPGRSLLSISGIPTKSGMRMAVLAGNTPANKSKICVSPRSSSVRPSRLRTGRTLRRLFPAGRCPRLIFTAR